MDKNQSLVIVGGGPVGLVLALTMRKHGLPFTVLEARKKGDAYLDKRALALSYGSKVILENLGVWHIMAANTTAINEIHVSQAGGIGRTRLDAAEHDLPALGYVVSYGALMQALDTQISGEEVLYEAAATAIRQMSAAAEIDYLYQGEKHTLKTTLVAIAEGGRSLGEIPSIERHAKAYGHDALVSMVVSELPHQHIAYERFTPTGPMALLPNGDRDFSLVWTGEKTKIDRLIELEEVTFLEELHSAFGDRVGRFLSIGKRLSFPLVKSELKTKVTPHIAVIGNSAQTMHPVAGQGFNVGLRDATSLAKVIYELSPSEWGNEAMLKHYADTRVRDTKGGLLFTDFLVNLFSNDLLGLTFMRGVGLGLLDIIPPAKRMLVSKMSYGK
ncbi:MAG: FAD-dependent monooxygenase [Methylotenera sp.]